MKAAVSIPDRVFQQAEELAAERGVTRSALYTQALEALLRDTEEHRLEEAINAVCEHVDTSIDPKLVRMQAEAVGGRRPKRSRRR